MNTFTEPFLTLLDSRAKIKGSRDPLGFQAIWTALGRRIIKNLTTITTSPGNFTTLLLGYYFAERLISKGKIEITEFVNIFLKFEQVAAYSRYSQTKNTDFLDEEIRGILRVKKNLSDSKRVKISIDQDAQILSNQKTYGIWGLYTVAARNSGLIEDSRNNLEPEIIQFIEDNYLTKLPNGGESLLKSLAKDTYYFEPKGKDKILANSLANILSPKLSKSEVEFYTYYLIKSGEENNLQSRLWSYIQDVNLLGDFSYRELSEIIKLTGKKEDIDLHLRLKDIKNIEIVIAPLTLLFNYIMGNDQREVNDVIVSIQNKWGKIFKHIDIPEFINIIQTLDDTLTSESMSNLINLAESLSKGNYESTIKNLIERNKIVMNDRGGNEWIKIHQNKLDVRFLEETGSLLNKKELHELWRHPYFINSLKIIGNRIQNSQK